MNIADYSDTSKKMREMTDDEEIAALEASARALKKLAEALVSLDYNPSHSINAAIVAVSTRIFQKWESKA